MDMIIISFPKQQVIFCPNARLNLTTIAWRSAQVLIITLIYSLFPVISSPYSGPAPPPLLPC